MWMDSPVADKPLLHPRMRAYMNGNANVAAASGRGKQVGNGTAGQTIAVRAHTVA